MTSATPLHCFLLPLNSKERKLSKTVEFQFFQRLVALLDLSPAPVLADRAAGRSTCEAVEEEEEEAKGERRKRMKWKRKEEEERRKTEEKEENGEEEEEGVAIEWETLFTKVTCEGSETGSEGVGKGGGRGLEEGMEVEEGPSEGRSFSASVLKVLSACLHLLRSHNVYQVRGQAVYRCTCSVWGYVYAGKGGSDTAHSTHVWSGENSLRHGRSVFY